MNEPAVYYRIYSTLSLYDNNDTIWGFAWCALDAVNNNDRIDRSRSSNNDAPFDFSLIIPLKMSLLPMTQIQQQFDLFLGKENMLIWTWYVDMNTMCTMYVVPSTCIT